MGLCQDLKSLPILCRVLMVVVTALGCWKWIEQCECFSALPIFHPGHEPDCNGLLESVKCNAMQCTWLLLDPKWINTILRASEFSCAPVSALIFALHGSMLWHTVQIPQGGSLVARECHICNSEAGSWRLHGQKLCLQSSLPPSKCGLQADHCCHTMRFCRPPGTRFAGTLVVLPVLIVLPLCQDPGLPTLNRLTLKRVPLSLSLSGSLLMPIQAPGLVMKGS